MNRMGRTRKKRSKRRSHQTLRTRGGDLLQELERIVSLRQTAQQKVDASQNINRRFLKSLKGGTINIKRAQPIVNTIAKQRRELTSNFPFSIQPFWNALASNSPNEEAILRAAVERLLEAPSELEANKRRIVEIKQLFTTLSNPRLQASKEVNQKWKNITRRASHASQMKMVNALRGIRSPVSEEKEEKEEKKDVQDPLLFFNRFGKDLGSFIWTEEKMGLRLIDFILKYVDGISKTVVIIPTLDTRYYSFEYIEISDMETMKQWIIYSMKLIHMMEVMQQEPSKRLSSLIRNTYHLTRIIAFLLYIKEGNKLPNTTFDMNTYDTRFYRLLFYVISYMSYRDGNEDTRKRIRVSIQQLMTMFRERKETQWTRDIIPYGIEEELIASARK